MLIALALQSGVAASRANDLDPRVPMVPAAVEIKSSPLKTLRQLSSTSWSDYFTSGIIYSTASECTSYYSFRTSASTATSISLTAYGTTRTCSDSSTAASIVSYWSACTSTYEGQSSSSCVDASWTCDGYTWRIGLCNGIEICVDCSSTCACNSGLSIRPCIGNSNWGGYSTTCSVCA